MTTRDEYSIPHEILAASLPPLPDGAGSCEVWTYTPANEYVREVYWPAHNAEAASAHVMGSQYDSGRVDRFVSAAFDQTDGNETIVHLSVETARDLATTLLAAVEEIER